MTPLVVETPADKPITLDLAAQATDPDGDTLFFVCCEAARGGGTTITASDAGRLTVVFTPDSETARSGGFSYIADDQQGHRVAGAVTVNVLAPTNRPPVATDASISVAAGSVGNLELSAFASDPDPTDQLTYAIRGGNGAVGLTLDGARVRMDAPINATDGTDGFSYTVTDRAGKSATANVTIAVTVPEKPPIVAVADTASTNQEQPVTIDVLTNDVDPVGGGLTIASTGGTPDGNRRAGFPAGLHATCRVLRPSNIHLHRRDAANTAKREASASVAVDVIGRPRAPSAPVATPGNAQAVVTWSLPAANGAPIDDVAIRVGFAGAEQAVGIASSFTVTGLTNGEPVTFIVRAHNAAGWGEWSAQSLPVTPDIEPGRPGVPSVQFADGASTVSWTPPTNSGSVILRYELQIGGGINETRDVGGNTSYTWTGLTNGSEYTFMVRAVNAKGPGEFSTPSASEHPLRVPGRAGGADRDAVATDRSVCNGCSLPTVATRSPTTRSSWSAAAQPTSPQRPRCRGRTCPTACSSSSACGRSTAAVGARGRRRPRRSSRVVFPIRRRHPALSAATSPPWSPGHRRTTRAAPSAATKYGPTRDRRSMQRPEPPRSPSPDPTNGTAYTFQVLAINEEGNGGFSGASGAVVPAGPPGATTLSATPGDVAGADLNWSAASGNGDPVQTYEININGGRRDQRRERHFPPRRRSRRTRPTATKCERSTPWAPVHGATRPPPEHQAHPIKSAGSGTTSTSSPCDGRLVLDSASGQRQRHHRLQRRSESWGRSNVLRWSPKHPLGGARTGSTQSFRVQACNELGCGPWSAARSVDIPSPRIQWRKGAAGRFPASATRRSAAESSSAHSSSHRARCTRSHATTTSLGGSLLATSPLIRSPATSNTRTHASTAIPTGSSGSPSARDESARRLYGPN